MTAKKLTAVRSIMDNALSEEEISKNELKNIQSAALPNVKGVSYKVPGVHVLGTKPVVDSMPLMNVEAK